MSSARNRGIQESKGVYLIFLDADDLLIHNCLHEYSEILKMKIDFIQSGYLCFVNSIGNVFFKRKTVAPYENFRESILIANIGPVNGFVLSKNLVDKVGFFNEQLTSCEDWEYWIRCSKSGYEPYIINKIFAGYRFVPGSMGKHSLRMLEQGLRVINLHHLNIDDVKIHGEHLLNNTSYKISSIRHLVFTTGIALFTNQIDFLETIKKNYFHALTIPIDSSVFSVFSNYQTYRDYGIPSYFVFYYRSHKKYKAFFKFLIAGKNIAVNDYDSILRTSLPNPFFIFISRLKKKKIKRIISI